MKRNNRIFVALLLIFSIFSVFSCTEDSSTVNIYGAFTTPTIISPAVRADGTVLFTGTTVNLTWASVSANGDPQNWNVYFGPGKAPALYKSGVTTQTLAVPVLDGQTYYWKVEILDGRKVKTTSAVNSFTAVNGTNPKMAVALVTTTDVKTSIGVDLPPDDVVDLRLLVYKKSDMSVVKTIDAGKSKEAFADFATLADGEYVLGVDIKSTINAGTINAPVNLSLLLQFSQLGMIDLKLDYPNVMTNANPCSLYVTYLANVKKAGAVYTIAKAVSYKTPAVISWKGKDDAYPSQVTTTASCSSTTMTGLGFGWMKNYWEEIIVSGGTLTYTVSGSTMTIPMQKYCKTTWNGAPQPEYSIDGTGTLGTNGIWTIKYVFYQGGKSIITPGNGIPAGYLQADITPN